MNSFGPWEAAMRRMRAMARKELRQLRRDHRTLALLVMQPLVLLIVFGYAATFDVDTVSTVAVGADAALASERLPDLFDVTDVDPQASREDAVQALRGGDALVGVVTGGGPPLLLIDGSQLFAARTVLTAAAQAGIATEVLFNPDLDTPPVLVPALAGIILAFVGTIATSLGVVRERSAGTIEQLAVMPLRPVDVLVGKVAPYFAVALLDLTLVMLVAWQVFDVPFVGSIGVFALGAVLFLLTTLGIGLLVSSVSENQGQAMQLAIMTALPQVLLSGAIFPLESMAAPIRVIAYVLPLTWFVQVARGVMLRDASLSDLALPIGVLAGLALFVFSFAILRVRRDLLPAGGPS